MEVYKLVSADEFPSLPIGSYGIPSDIIEDYSSFIWTERFGDPGEFQMKTPKIEETMNLLPLGSQISHKDTRQVMIVETHSIDKDDKGVGELTTKGRTLEVFFEDRQILNSDQAQWELPQDYTVQRALGLLIWDVAINTNPSNSATDGSGAGPVNHTVNDTLYNTLLTETIRFQTGALVNDPSDLQTAQAWFLRNDYVLPQIADFLASGKLGLRTIRPPSSSTDVLTYSLAGVPSHSSVTNTEKIIFDIYNGQVRTITPAPVNPNPAVIFRYDAGHLENPKYLFSRRGAKNFIRVMAGVDDYVEHWEGWPDVNLQPFNLDRQMGFLDVGNVDVSIPTQDYLRQRAVAELRKLRRKAFLDASVPFSFPYAGNDYNVDYFLGDIVSVIAEYGLEQDMRVTEFTWTEDAAGERGFPTLAQVE